MRQHERVRGFRDIQGSRQEERLSRLDILNELSQMQRERVRLQQEQAHWQRKMQHITTRLQHLESEEERLQHLLLQAFPVAEPQSASPSPAGETASERTLPPATATAEQTVTIRY